MKFSMVHRFLYLVSLIMAAVSATPSLRAQAGANVNIRLAFTFSDAPGPDGKIFAGREQTDRLLEALKSGHIAEAAFYINPASLAQPGGTERVQAYARAGHRIGLYVPVPPSAGADFIAEFKKGHEVVSKLPNFFPSVRYPVPKDPRQDVIPAEVLAAMTGAGYAIGYYTASASDARMNQLLQRAIEDKKPINWEYLRDVYLRLHVESLQFYDQMANVVSNNRVGAHVLLLHENDLSARFMLALIVQCRRMGVETITATEALNDPVAQMIPKQSLQARIVGLALERQGNRALTPERATDEGMDRMFEFFNAFTGKK
jgi:peptidoglycan-N-acetylglucosamine deacetylase